MLRQSSSRAIIGATLAGCALSSWETPAHASENYPSVVARTLDMPCTPGCTLCHTTAIGTGLSVRNYRGSFIFAVKVAYNATASKSLGNGDEAALRAALSVAGDVDADLDGTKDLDELRAGLDPNTADAEARICGPGYGCGARVAKAPASLASSWLVVGGVAALVALGLRRRRAN
jgi:hypothetical protein